ncbi:MAG: hypothetical protein WC700_10065 [Gemmatimonadaceae bacterium]|jgi:hypothetical protein
MTDESELDKWGAAVAAWAAALGAYADEVGASGPRAIGGRWRRAADELELVAAPGTPPTTLRAEMDAGDALDSASDRLERVTAAFLDPNVVALVSSGMSRTYSDAFGHLTRRVRASAADAEARRRAAIDGVVSRASPAGPGLDEIEAAYKAQPRSAYATELYTSALLCRRGDARAGRLLEGAKDRALGCSDGPREASEAFERLIRYHPIQAMGYAPRRFEPAAAATPGGAPPVDLSLGGPTVRYDLAPLIDRRRAAAFGPIASVFSGLSFKTVERLRTITAAVDVASASAGAMAASAARPLAVPAGEPVRVAFGRGAPAQEMHSGAETNAALWAPFAGPRSRVEAYARATSDIIIEQIRADNAETWSSLRSRFEADEGGGPTAAAVDPGVLAGVLAEELARRYDEDPPETPDEFLELAVGEAFQPEHYATSAVARAFAGAADSVLRRVLVGAAAPLVPYEVAEREYRITHALAVLDAARGVWLALNEKLRGADLAKHFAEPDPSRRRDGLMRDFRRAAEPAEALELPGSLKIYSLLAPKLEN